ncbi:MAG TPA: hypothetical protein VFH94_28420, partial [Streptomyces sp.]|nr:hypothetical protein [Streptomyces sp.]
MRSRKRRSAPGPDETAPAAGEGEPTRVVVTDTGDARAHSGGTALTGHRGPAVETGSPPVGG